MDLLTELRELYAIARNSLIEATADKRAPMMARAESLAQAIADLEREAGKVADPIDEITARRAARGGSTARTRSTQGGSG